MKSAKPRVIAFDVFGTLLYIQDKKTPYKKLLQWLSEHGRLAQMNDAAMIMSNPLAFQEIIQLFDRQVPSQVVEQLQLDLDLELKSICLYDDTLMTIEKLKAQGFKLAVCSNLATPYGEMAATLLPVFDAYAWSYEVGAIKPDPKIYQHIVDQLACQTEDVLFIGDTLLADVQGPTAFGMSARLIDRRRDQKMSDILHDILD